MKQVQGKDVLAEILVPPTGGGTPVWTPFVCAKDMAIKITPELINKTTLSSGFWNEFKPRRIDWELSLSGVTMIVGPGWTAFDTIKVANLFTGWQVRLTFADTDGNNAVFSGKIFFSEADISGNQDEFSLFDNTLKGTGAYTLVINNAGGGGGGGGTPPTPVTLNAPGSFAFGTVTQTTCPLSWTDTNTTPPESSLRIEIATDGQFNNVQQVIPVAANATSYTVTGLFPNTSYAARIKAVGNGSSTLDSPWSTTLLIDTPPAADTRFLVEWNWYVNDPLSLVQGGGFTAIDSTLAPLGAPVVADTRQMPDNMYLVTRYPDTESTKTVWQNTSFNYGTIPDFAFRDIISLSGKKYIVSRRDLTMDPLQQTTFS